MVTLARADRVTLADLRHLVVPDPDRESGVRLRHCYRKSANLWVARVWVGGRRGRAVPLGTARTESGAGKLVVAHFLAVYGPDWPEKRRAERAAANRRPVADRPRPAGDLPAGAGRCGR